MSSPQSSQMTAIVKKDTTEIYKCSGVQTTCWMASAANQINAFLSRMVQIVTYLSP
jgi:hypothetical protein